MIELMRALRYPWQGKGCLRRMLTLALWQFIPVVGQILLVGYGQAIARAIYHQQSDLPRLKLQQSFVDGLRLIAVGFIYGFPIILMVLLTLGASDEADAPGGIPPIFFTAIMLISLRISREIIKWQPALKPILSVLNRVVTAAFFIFVLFRLSALFPALRSGLQFSPASIQGSNLIVLFFALLLFATIVVVLLVAAVRFALTGSSLLKPTSTLQLMARNRLLSVRLIGLVWLVAAGTSVATVIGATLLFMPGLLSMVAGSLSIWFLVTQYVIKAEAGSASLTPINH